MWLIDLDAIPTFPQPFSWMARFEGRDHLGDPQRSIQDNVVAYLAENDIDLTGGRVVMLANARVAGYVFNPISVHWCYDRDGALTVILAEVHNTYGERHVYLLRPDSSGRTQADIADWLRVPVTTIARRIAHAKRRLRGHALRAFAGDLRRGRRVSGEAFLVEFTARLRRLDPRDAGGVALLASRLGLDHAPRVAPAALPSAYVIEDPESPADRLRVGHANDLPSDLRRADRDRRRRAAPACG